MKAKKANTICFNSTLLLTVCLLLFSHIIQAADAKKAEATKKTDAKKPAEAAKKDAPAKKKEAAKDAKATKDAKDAKATKDAKDATKEEAKEEAAAAPAPPEPEPVSLVPKFKDFRLGKILAAEISPAKVAIKNLNKHDLPKSMEPKKKKSEDDEDDDAFDSDVKYGFAVVALRLNMGRTISIYDYELTDGNENYKCIALSKNDTPFDIKNWLLKDAKQWDTVKLLFEVQLPTVEVPKMELSMKNKVLPDKEDEIVLPFKILEDGKFTSSKKIPADGMLFVEEEEAAVTPAKAAAAAKPAKAAPAKKPEKKALPADIGPSS